MSRSLIVLFTSLLIAFGVQFSYAQPGRGQGMDPEQQINELIAALDITAEQEPDFREAMAQVNELRMGGGRGMREGRGRGQGEEQDGEAAHEGHGAGGAQAGADAEAGANGRGMEMMAQRRAEMEAKTDEILAPVLSDAQLAKYKELEAERMEQMMSRMRRQ